MMAASTLTCLAPLGPLSRSAGEGGPGPLPNNPPPHAGEGMGGGWVGEGGAAFIRLG
jgi:hypothetical protein